MSYTAKYSNVELRVACEVQPLGGKLAEVLKSVIWRFFATAFPSHLLSHLLVKLFQFLFLPYNLHNFSKIATLK